MRIVTIVLSALLLVLAAAPLATNFAPMPAALAPYAEIARPVAPWAIAGVALLLFFALLVARPKAPAAPTVTEATAPVAAAPATNRADADVVHFLGLLQEKGRLVDFLMDDIAGHGDADIGAAARILHEGCRAVLQEHFKIRPVREESEGSKITVPRGYAPDDYRLVGRIGGEAPFTGTLVHHGWKTDWVKLPRLLGRSADRPPAIAPAEVELG